MTVFVSSDLVGLVHGLFPEVQLLVEVPLLFSEQLLDKHRHNNTLLL